MAVNCVVSGYRDGLTATITGRLRLPDTVRLRAYLFKCLAEQPDALFVDLAGLVVEDPLALSVFSVVSRQAARWPGIPVLLCAPGEQARELLSGGAYRRLPVFASIAEAREHTQADRRSLPSLADDLVPIAGAARQARNVATEACLRWDLPGLIAPASVIAGELVTNVVDHANTMATLRISLRPRYVMIGVQDGSAEEPRLVREPGPRGGRGLLLVEAMAASWGWLPVDGGKVVWAALRRG